jgi:PKD repeat protein
LENPFKTPISFNLSQEIPKDITVINTANGTIYGNNITWHMNLEPNENRRLVVLFAYNGELGVVIETPQTVLDIYDSLNDKTVSFQSNSNNFTNRFPVDIRAYPPENASVGNDIIVPIYATNLLNDKSFSGNFIIEMINSDKVSVYNSTTTFSLSPNETQKINLIASPKIDPGLYILKGTLQGTKANKSIFEGYISIDSGDVIGNVLLANQYNHNGSKVRLGNYNVTTLPDGSYIFIGIPKGNYSLTISHQGYLEYNGEVKVSEGLNVIPQITLADIAPPSSITNLSFTSGTTWLNWTWTNPEDSDFNHTELYLNGTFIINIITPQNYSNITGLSPDTLYELGTRTADSSGSINETWVNATARTLFLSDSTPPTITFISPTDPDGTVLTTRSWTFINVSLSEPGLTWLEWNGTNESMSGSDANWYINKTGLANGVYTYRVWANDSGGNLNVSETRTIEIDYITDTLPPIITIVSPVNNTTYSTNSVDLNYSVTEPTIWQGYSLDGAGNITLSGNTTLTGLIDGVHILVVYANDTSGNMNSSKVSFTIDNMAPVINSVMLNNSTPNTNDAILVTVNATDNVGVTGVVANGASLINQGGNIWNGTITALAGTHSVNVSASDAASNTGWNNSTSYTATTPPIPDTAPPKSIDNPILQASGSTWLNFTWTNPSDNDFNHTEIYLAGIFQINISDEYFNATGLIPNTQYEISTRTVDHLGNINQTWVNDTAITLNTPPFANASGPYSGVEGTPLIFNASASYDPDPGDSIINFEWDFDSNGITDASGMEVTWTWNDNYTGQVTLTVTDSHGGRSSDTTTVIILNQPPIVDAGVDQTGNEGDIISFSGSFTDAGKDDTHTIEWDFGDGTTVTGVLNSSHIYADNGTYTVTLTVTDDDGGYSSDTLIVTVNNAAPSIEAGNIQTINEGESVSLDPSTFHDNGTLDTHTAMIKWGDGTAEEIGLVIESPYGPPGSTSGASGTISGSHVYADNATYIVEICITDDDGASACDTFEVKVINVAPAISNSKSEVTIQYSDKIGIVEITATDIKADMPFSLSTSWKKEADSAFIKIPVLPEGLTVSAKGCSEGETTATCTWELAGKALIAPGRYIVRFEVRDDDGALNYTDITLKVSREDARSTYTGVLFTSTSSATSRTAKVTLSATIQDISAVELDPVYDPDEGDIRNGKVSFIDRDSGNSVLCTASVGLVSLDDPKTGTATCDWEVDIGQADSKDFTIGIVVDNYYTRDASDENTVVTVSKPLNSFITGGGYLIMTNSAGLYPGAQGTKVNFGFSVKYNKKGTNLQGRVNIIVRNGGRVYQIRSNAIDQLAVNSNKATFNSRANIKDITDLLNPVSIDGNAALQMTLTDNGEPGSSDSIAMSVLNKNGGLWYSSNWDGTNTIEKTLGGGNLVAN